MQDELNRIQEKTSLLPDYTLKQDNVGVAGKTLSGLVGGMLVLVCSVLVGIILKKQI